MKIELIAFLINGISLHQTRECCSNLIFQQNCLFFLSNSFFENQWNTIFVAFSMIVEATAGKVSQFMMPQKSIYNKNFCFNEHWITVKKVEYLYNCPWKFVLSTFSVVPSLSFCLYYIKMHCSIENTKLKIKLIQLYKLNFKFQLNILCQFKSNNQKCQIIEFLNFKLANLFRFQIEIETSWACLIIIKFRN